MDYLKEHSNRKGTMNNKAVFLDRDKTLLIPKKNNYIYRVGDFNIPEEYIESLSVLSKREYQLFIVTNQGRIAKGYLTEKDVISVHNHIEETFRRHGFSFMDYAYCPHNPVGNIAPYNVVCSCRKPKPGLFRKIIEKHRVDVSRSWMIGDTERDMKAGKLCGLKTILVKTGDFDYAESADFVDEDLAFAVKRILNATA